MKPIIIIVTIFTITPLSVFADLIDFEAFSDPSKLTSNGAVKVNDSNLRLTDGPSQAGSAFWPYPLALDQTMGFRTWFQFQITDRVESGGASGGLAFVMQPRGSHAIGQGDSGLGYGGISPSVTVEFDTHRNSWDPNGNHIGINIDGDVVSQAAYYHPFQFDNGSLWNALIELAPKRRFLEISVSGRQTKPPFIQFTYFLDLEDVFDCSDEIFIGFTAASGGSPYTYDILTWHFNCPSNPVPLPSAFLLLLTGIIGLFGIRTTDPADIIKKWIHRVLRSHNWHSVRSSDHSNR